MAACKIGNTEYDSLSAAITAATENATITLLDNMTENVSINGKSITIVLDGKTLTNTITISNGSLTIDGKTLSVSQGSATAVFDNGSLTTVTGSDAADIITGNFNHVTINGGKGDDTIENGGNSSVSIDGSEGNDVIILTETTDPEATETAINVSQDDDTINVGSNVQKFSVTGFEVGDKLHFEAGSISAAEYDNDALNVTLTVDENGKTVTVNGMTSPTATVDNTWLSVSGSAATYGKTSGTSSVKSGNDFSLESVAGETYFTIGGLNSALTVDSLNGDDSPVTVDNKTVTLGAGALDKQNVTISGGDYKLSLAANVDTVQDTINWVTSYSGGNYLRYYTGRTGEYYSSSSDQKSVTYHASVEGTWQFSLSNITGTPTVDGTTVKLTAGNFNSSVVNISNNAGGYQFSLGGGDFNNKTFTGAGGNDTIINSGNNVRIQSHGGHDSITNNGDNVSINGGSGDDNISNSGNNVSINGGGNNDYISNSGDNVSIMSGEGNDTINLTGGTGATVNVSLGDDLINVGSNVTSFTVEDFKAGDRISLQGGATSLETVSGGIKAGNVSITGITSIGSVGNSWSGNATNGFVYNKTSIAGAYLRTGVHKN